jgi:hypothetical protein
MPRSAMIQESELSLCARLVRALTHHIRGDLSVITNDLTYLSALVDPREVARARDRCTRVASTIAKLSALVGTVEKRLVPASDLLRLFGGQEADASLRSREVLVDMALASRVVSMLRKLTGPWERCHGSAENGCLLIRVARGPGSEEARRFVSCSACAADERGEEGVIEECLVDFIVRDHGWNMGISRHPYGFEFELRVPYREVSYG